MKAGRKHSVMYEAVMGEWPLLRGALVFSFFISLLILAPSIYMLEVYDRVVNSRSEMTLAMLTLGVFLAYVVMELLEWARTGVLRKVAEAVDRKVGELIFNTVFEANLRRIPGVGVQPLHDLRTVRDFLPSPPLTGMMDAPMSLIFVAVVFYIHPMLGVMSLVSAVLQVGVAFLTERGTGQPLSEANRYAGLAQNYASNSLRNTQVIEAMGMQSGIHGRWMELQRKLLVHQATASDRAGGYGALAKLLQLSTSSLMLGLGCWLILEGSFTGSPGLLMVASILGGRVLAPIVQVIGGWKNVVGAREAYGRLVRLLEEVPLREPGMPLPAPQGNLVVENLMAGAPGNSVPILRGVGFAVPAGKLLVVVGPSASGKSTLARLLVGVWPALSGKVRLDGVDIFPWNKAELGPHVGYLPQDVELFEGTIAENIARFNEVDPERVEEAARSVGLHELIMGFPRGYETNIGDEGCFLSGGQRQRVGLARAIYGQPRLVVLDEPNSSLDEQGEAALATTLQSLKARGVTVVVVTHRVNVLQFADLMLVLQEGAVRLFGPRDEVLLALQRAAQPAAPAPVPAPMAA